MVNPTQPTASDLTPDTGLHSARRAAGSRASAPGRARRRLLSVFVCLSVLVALGVVSASPALAAQQRVFQGAFGCAEGAPGCTTPDPYPLASNPWSVAVDHATGDVFVADALNHRVQEFNAKGQFVLMFGKDVNPAGISEAEQNVCTAVSLDACQPGVASSEPGGFESITRKEGGGTEPSSIMFVAVDNSGGPSSGDVYVGDFDEHGAGNRVSKFDSAGGLLSGWGEGGELTGAGVKSPPAPQPGPFGQIKGIAVGPSGDLWVATSTATFQFNAEAAFKTDWPTPVPAAPFGITVDAQENLYFLNTREVVEVSATGTKVGRITEPGEQAHPILTFGVAVDPASEDLSVLEEEENFEPARVQLQRYLPGCLPAPLPPGVTCTAVETFTSPRLTAESAEAHGVAFGPGEGDTGYVTDRQTGEVRFFSVATVPGVVTGKPSGLTGVTAVLEGAVDPSGEALEVGEAGCRFEWGLAGGAYEHTVGCAETAAEIGSGMSDVAVHAEIKGLQVGVSYHYRLLAANANDRVEPAVGGDVVFGPPLIVSESSVQVGSQTAGLQAQVDPQSVDTRVRVEYGTGTEYGEKTAELDIGAGGGAQPVPVSLEGLLPGTEYHYRFVAENALGEGAGAVVGPDRVFRTEGAGSFRLADSRAWELVSPRVRHGALIEPLGSSYAAGEEIQAAADGSAVSYVTNNPLEDVAGFPEFAQVLSTRTATGWVSHDLSVAHSGAVPTTTAVTEGREYRYFSEDLSHAAVQPQGPFAPCESSVGVRQPCVSPQASEQTAFVQDLHSGVFTPLVTGCPSSTEEAEGHACPAPVAEHADVPAGTVFGQKVAGGAGTCPPNPYCGPAFRYATPDLGHVVLESPVALSEEPGAAAGLYEASAGRLTFVGNGVLGAKGVERSTNYRHAISNDGSRVFWTSGTGLGAHLYMRDTVSGELLQLDVPQPECVAKGECKTGEVNPEFQLASADGERVLFTDTQQLTTSSGAREKISDLYQCQITETAGKPSCALTDLTPANGSEPADVQGVIAGAGEDAAYVYFVAKGVLGDAAQHGAAPGAFKLYVTHEGVTSLIAQLSGADNPDWGQLYIAAPTARVSPNGRWLAFMSNQSLTGYDNRDAVSGQPDEEVYLYDATTQRLVCASCDPTGARPHGREYQNPDGQGLENTLVGSFFVWDPNTWLAANIPTWTPQTYHNAIYQSRYLSDEGRLFFNTLDGLVPKDANSQQDVYEYEPAGTPSGGEGVGPAGARCEPSAASGSEVYRPQHEFKVEGQEGVEGAGCVALISGGASGEESAFMDASQTGGDVFFISSAHLVPGTIENGTSLYDAHECTTASPCTHETETPPPCKDAEGCRPAPEPQPPIYGPPSSATFHGPGNPTPAPPATGPKPKTAAQIRAEKLKKALKACRKKRPGHKRALCEKAAKKAYGAKSARKSARKATR